MADRMGIDDCPCVALALAKVSEQTIIRAFLAVTRAGGGVTAECLAIERLFLLKLAEMADVAFTIRFLVCARGAVELIDVFARSRLRVTAIIAFLGIERPIGFADILVHFIFA